MPRTIFKLVGLIGMKGVEHTEKQLKDINDTAKRAAMQFGKVGRAAQKLGTNLTKYLTVPLAGAALAAYKGAQAASDLAEEQGKAGQIFGESAKQIDNWSNTAATAFGQSKTQAMQAASTFAIFGKSAGLVGSELTSFSTDFTELASDLASFNNTSPEEAIVAIGAALRGESEPIRRYGVLLDDASLRQEAVRKGIIRTTKEALTPQQKVLAASSLIYKQTADAQGDFKRTADGAANSQRMLKAQIADVSAQLGKLFLPLLLKATNILKDKVVPAIAKMVGWFEKLSPGMKKTIVMWAALAAALGPVLIVVGKVALVIKTLIPLYKAWILGQATLNAVMTANPIGVVIMAIAALTAAIIFLVNNWDLVKEKTAEVWDWMKHAATQGVSYIKSVIFKLAQVYLDYLNIFGQFIPGVNKALDVAKRKLGEMMAAESELRQERKKSRIEAKKAALETEELKKAVEGAKKAVSESTTSWKDHTAALKDDKQAATDRAAEEKRIAEERAALEEDFAGKVREKTFTKLELLEYEKAEALRLAEELGAESHNVNEYYGLEEQRIKDEMAEQDRKRREKEKQAESNKWQSIAGFGVNAIGQMFDMARMAHDNKLAMVDQELSRQVAATNASVLTEEQKESRIAELNEQADKKKRALQVEAAKREKSAAIFSAVINTAQAISKALTLGAPVGIIMAGVMGILGAIQIGIIASKPIPKFAEGGFVKGGRGGITAEVGEGGADELVMPMEKGIDAFINAMFAKLRAVPEPPAQAAGFGDSPAGGSVTLNIGTFIGDDRGLKELERRLRPLRISEDQRIAVAGA